jgi:putative ABC transport system ATP-binding protein
MLIQLKNTAKTFGKDESIVKAVKNVSLSINEGDYVAVCGPSGSGKTTLLTMMAGMQHPTQGKVYIDEISIYEDLDNDGLAKLRSEYIGFIFQAFNLIPYLTGLENILLPLAPLKITTKDKKAMALEALKRVGMSDRAEHLPSELSGGQLQRIAIARALVNKPLILFADEPTGNLDTVTRDEIMELFASLNRENHTIIMVSHDPVNIKEAGRQIEIIDGKIKEKNLQTTL